MTRNPNRLNRIFCFLTVAVLAMVLSSCGNDNLLSEPATTRVTTDTSVDSDLDSSISSGEITSKQEDESAKTTSKSTQSTSEKSTATSKATTISTTKTVSPPPAVEASYSHCEEELLSSLSANEKIAFDSIYSGMINMEETVYLPSTTISRDNIAEFISLILKMLPQENYISENYRIIVTDDFVTEITLSYSKSKSEASNEIVQLENAGNKILSGLKSSMTEFEKVVYLHDKIIEGCEYADSGTSVYSAYGCLVEGKACCEGYSKAMYYLCQRAEIYCINVSGIGRTNGESVPHMWNKIKMNGKWYNVDVTWDDPIISGLDIVRYDYLGITDSDCGTSHTEDTQSFVSIPKATSIDCNYFNAMGYYINSASSVESILEKTIVGSATAGKTSAEVRCKSSEIYNNIISEYLNTLAGKNKIFGMLSSAQNAGNTGISAQSYSSSVNDEMLTITIIYQS